MKFISKVSKIGNSYFLIIPRMVVNREEFVVDDLVEVTTQLVEPTESDLVVFSCKNSECNHRFQNHPGEKYLCPVCNGESKEEKTNE